MTLPPQCWTPKPSTPPYIPVTVTDIYRQVQAKWTSLGSPAAQCPSPQFGAVGSPENEACRARVAPLWAEFEKVFPDVPAASPYNRIVDLVLAEEVCALGYYEDPEADIGPAPNLFENPGGLSQKLQEWHLRSLVPSLCEPCGNSPGTGDCYCWPYYVTVNYQYKDGIVDEWRSGSTTTAAWGPIKGARVVAGPEIPSMPGLKPFDIQVGGSQSQRFVDSNPFRCEVGTFWHSAGGFSAAKSVEITGSLGVVPFSRQDCIDIFQEDRHGPGETDACPRPTTPPRLPELPNTGLVYMPLPVPIISFPPPASCPTSPEDYVNITVNLPETPGPAGPPGPQGEKGRDGDGYMRYKALAANYDVIDERATDSGDFGGVHNLPPGIAYVSVRWRLTGPDQVSNRVRRFNNTFDPGRIEFAYGNVYLRLQASGDTLGPFTHGSLGTLLVEVPDTPGEQWQLLVNDKGDVGYDIVDLGYRWVTRRFANPDDVPEVSYPL